MASGNDKYDSLVEKLVLSIHQDVAVIKTDQAEIKQDLKEHMKRTAVAETAISEVRRHVYIGYGIVLAISALIGVFLKLFKV